MTRRLRRQHAAASAVRHDGGQGAARLVGLDGRRRRRAREESAARCGSRCSCPTSSLPRSATRVLLQEQFRRSARRSISSRWTCRRWSTQSTRTISMRRCSSFSPDPSVTRRKQNLGHGRHRPNGQNFLSTRIPKVDALLDSATPAFDPAQARRRIASRAFQTIIDDAPAIWLYDVVYSTRSTAASTMPRRCAPTSGGRTSPTGRSRPTSASLAIASDSPPAKP